MIGQSTRIGRIFGVELRVDWSWMLVFLLLTWNLFAVFTVWHPSWTPAGIFVVALTASLLFFACIVLHELAHALVAKAQGTPVRSIRLFLFGGIADIEREPPSPRAEFLTAVVGPITSIVLGIVFLFLASAATSTSMQTTTSTLEGFSRLGPLGTLLAWLGPINVAIGIFNLVPAFPLDGGRILRSILWGATGDLGRATRTASWIGGAIGWCLVVAGIAMSFGIRVPFFGVGLSNGIWLAFIGWFIATAASRTGARTALDEALAGVTVAQLMQRNIPTVRPELPLATVIQDYFLRSSDRAVVVADGDRFWGLLCLADIRNVPADQWGSTAAGDVMRSADALAVTTPDRPITEAFDSMVRQDINQLPVLEHSRLAGMLRRTDVTRWLELTWQPGARKRTEAHVSARSQPRKPGSTPPGDEPFVRPI
jgi:Zn-dependent protease/CBS domain-containing protein